MTLYQNIRYVVLAVLLGFFGTTCAHAQLSLTGVAIPGAGGYVDMREYPVIKARFRATRQGAAVSLTSANVMVLEKNRYIRVRNLTVESAGVYTAEIATSVFQASGALVLYASESGDVGALAVSWQDVVLQRGANVYVLDSTFRRVPLYLDYGNVIGGSEKLEKLNLQIFSSTKNDQGTERPVRIDSLYTRTNNFRTVWKGTYGSKAPPTTLEPGSDYRFDLICAPTDSRPVTDVLTVVYEGGSRVEIMLLANSPTYTATPVLRVTYPNGGEHFAPCEEVPLRWTGSTPGFHTHAEYSLDNGRSWKFIDSTYDSTLVWRVPPDISDSARIRVYQKQTVSGSRFLQGEAAPASKLVFSADGRYLAVAYNNGGVTEFDITNGAVVRTYQAQGVSAPSSLVTALTYVGGTRNLAVAVPRGNGTSELQLFTPGTTGPVRRADVPVSTPLLVGSSVEGSELSVCGSISARVFTYDANTLASLQPIVLAAPASAASIVNNVLHIALVNGVVYSYSLATRAEVRQFDTKLPISGGSAPQKLAVTPSYNVIALAGMAYPAEGNEIPEQRTFVFDTRTNALVRTLYRQSSDAVGLTFNASESYLSLGYRQQPQIRHYDLVTGVFSGPIIGMPSHTNVLTDISYAPDGSTLATCSVDNRNNVLIRRLSTPESDQSDAVFSVTPVSVPSTPISFGLQYIGVSVDTVISTAVCNTGIVPIIVTSMRLQNGTWATLADVFRPDTIRAGACKTIRFSAVARDSGVLVDTLLLGVCEGFLRVPVRMPVLDRNLTMPAPFTEMGNVCVGDTARKRITLVRNNDPISVRIDGATMRTGLNSQFRVVLPSNRDVPPGGSLEADVLFVPSKLGADTDEVIIAYASQVRVTRTITVAGFGAGADVSLSHTNLAFIPEIGTREVVIRNRSNNEVVITGYTLPASAPFTVVTALPVTIPAQDSIVVRVQHLGGAISGQDVLAFTVTPCAAALTVRLLSYTGTAIVQAPAVLADPRGDVDLPLTAVLTENVPYQGMRTFETVLTVNPRLFLARSIQTSIGTAEILSQDIVNSVRQIRVRVSGSFPASGVIATITGPAGLAETTTSPLQFNDPNGSAFGSAVQTSYTDGELRIILADSARRILHPATLAVRSITPQPVADVVTVRYWSEVAGTAVISIEDGAGTSYWRGTENIDAGERSTVFNGSQLPSGVYVVTIRVANASVAHRIVVLR
mgnify:CR=1 FL=1